MPYTILLARVNKLNLRKHKFIIIIITSILACGSLMIISPLLLARGDSIDSSSEALNISKN